MVSRFVNFIRIIYLLLIIFISVAVFFFLLDYWNLIDLRRVFPFMQRFEVPLIENKTDASVKKEKFEKMNLYLRDKEIELQEQLLVLNDKLKDIQNREKELQEKLASIQIKETEKQTLRQLQDEKEKRLAQMANRIIGMPPEAAVKILKELSPNVIAEVFVKIEEIDAREGRNSIVPYLLTLLPSEQSSTILEIMLDVEADLLPR